MKDDIIRLGINPLKINLVYNGIDLKRFYPRTENEELKKSLRVNGKGPIIGTVGRMVSEKGHVYLIQALKYLNLEFKDLRCLFVGEGPLLEPLKKLAYDRGVHDMCIFAGMRKDVEHIYPVLDIFVLPSLREPFGLVLLEAMASEIPSIATGCGGPLELIKSDINGVLVPPKNSQMLAAAIKNLLLDRNKANTIAKEGRKTVEKYFDVKNFAKKIDDIYLSMAKSI